MAPLRPNKTSQDRFVLDYAHAQATGDTTIKLWKLGRRIRIEKVRYNNPTGLANDATNIFNVKLMNGSTIMANWSTLTGAEGALPADTFVTLTNSATDANLVAAADDVLSLFLDEGGDSTLPAGRIQIEGYYV